MAIETPLSCSFHNFIAEDLFSPAPELRSFPARGANLCSTFHSHRICRMKIIKKMAHSIAEYNLDCLFISFFLIPTTPFYTQTHTHARTQTQTHTHTYTISIGLPWTSDKPIAETSTWQHTTLTTDRYQCILAGFEPAVRANERPQTHSLDRTADGNVSMLN